MSGYAAGLVWRSNLAADLKPVAAVMADHGNDEGDVIWPSMARLAWMLGRSERAVQTAVRRLEELRVIRCVANVHGGRGLTRHYVLDFACLPQRLSWREIRAARKGEVHDNGDRKGEVHGRKGEVHDAEDPKRVKPTSPEPSVVEETSEEPSSTVAAAATADSVVTARDVLREHSDRFKAKCGARPTYTGQDTGLAKQFARKLQGGLPALRHALDAFFDATDGWWVERNAYSVPVFVKCHNDAIMAAANGNGLGMNPRSLRNMRTAARVLSRYENGGVEPPPRRGEVIIDVEPE